MKVTQRVRKILANYESDNPGTKGNLARILIGSSPSTPASTLSPARSA
jgi:hypothetical protein